MKNAKKILVTTASSEIFIIRRGEQKVIRQFCRNCQSETEMLDFNSAVNIFSVGAREIIRRIEANTVHSAETENGHLLVCVKSLREMICK